MNQFIEKRFQSIFILCSVWWMCDNAFFDARSQLAELVESCQYVAKHQINEVFFKRQKHSISHISTICATVPNIGVVK